jgi:starch phosphorylase
LVVSDPDRLDRLLNDPERPVQIVFAGKAHPRDEEGKRLVRRIFRLSQEPRFERRIVFLENYNIDVATHLVQGVDVWLNTPLRPQEASGTSGIKASLNGALNASVLDGWWEEAYSPDIGWAIGNHYEAEDSALRDSIDAASLYALLEDSVIPLFYDEPDNGSRDAWTERMKASIASIAPRFNTERMLGEYCDRFYIPAHRRAADLLDDGSARAKGLAWWKGHVSHHWNQIRISRIDADIPGELSRGEVVEVRAYVETGRIATQDVIAQIYEGPLGPLGEIQDPQIIGMQRRSVGDDGLLEFVGQFRSSSSGRHGYTVRVMPHHADLPDAMHFGRIRWA